MITPTQAWFAKWGVQIALAGALLLTVFYGGKLHERAANAARINDAVEAAVWLERSGTEIAGTAESDALKTAKTQKEKADAEIIELRAALAAMPRCAVARDAVRMLDGKPRVPATTAPATLAGAAAPRVAGDTGGTLGDAPPLQPSPASGGGSEVAGAGGSDTVDASVVLENCGWNRLNVAEPNAQQLEQVQAFYARLIEFYNHKP